MLPYHGWLSGRDREEKRLTIPWRTDKEDAQPPRGDLSDLLAGLTDGFALAQQNVGSPEFLNDLFGVVSFLRHGSDLLSWLFTTFDLDQLFRARSITNQRTCRDTKFNLVLSSYGKSNSAKILAECFYPYSSPASLFALASSSSLKYVFGTASRIAFAAHDTSLAVTSESLMGSVLYW